MLTNDTKGKILKYRKLLGATKRDDGQDPKTPHNYPNMELQFPDGKELISSLLENEQEQAETD